MADITVKIDSSEIKEYIDNRIQELMAEYAKEQKAQDVLFADTQAVIDACRNHLPSLFAQMVNQEDDAITKHFAKEMVERGERNNKVEPNHAFPDEIDLYNFFEKWRGYARCWNLFGHVTSCHTIQAYSEKYHNSNGIEYFIDDNRYHAIKFKDRGTFLVSEKRYQELKAKKGEI
ncbi:hypothetical protein [Bacteroides pyogenes]|uniref:hypothetical protein n=1 Tax=Bacteroides pyogenes TaxID=310300 RepID=UPI002FDA1CF9